MFHKKKLHYFLIETGRKQETEQLGNLSESQQQKESAAPGSGQAGLLCSGCFPLAQPMHDVSPLGAQLSVEWAAGDRSCLLPGPG